MPVRDERVFFTFTMLLSCVVIPAMCYVTGAFPKPFVWVPPVFDCYLVALAAYALRRLRLSWVVWLIAVLLLGGEVFCLLCYQSPYSMTVLQLLLETNRREVTEFLSGYFIVGWLALSFAIILAAIFAGRAVCRAVGSLPLRWKKWGARFFFFILLFSASCQGYSYFRLRQAYTANVTTAIAENKHMPLRNSPFVRFLYGHALNVVSTKELGRLVRTIRQCQVDSCSFRSPVILLIIGESYNKYHSPLYNPQARQTTPGLCALRDQGNLVVYDDAVSPYNVTSKVFRQMFSTYYPGCGRSWEDCPLFPAMMKKAGYNIWFFTNQFAGEENNKNHHDHVGGTIFNQSELRRLQFTHTNSEATRYDMELLRQLPSPDTLAATPSMLILHMIGQHEDYRERYPGEYNRFTADSIQNPFANREGRQVVAEYDNATLYNDAVVTALLQRYASLDVVAVYLSDHGEEIYDWRNSCYRTNSSLMTPEIARYQYEIPLLFYLSDSYRAQHPGMVHEIQTARHRPFLSTMLPFLIFHLAGVSCPDYESQYDILSPGYDVNYPRIIRDDVCYDELMHL